MHPSPRLPRALPAARPARPITAPVLPLAWLMSVLLVAVLAVALAAPAQAQAPGAAPAAGSPAKSGPVKLRTVPRHAKVAQGGELVVAVEMDFGTEYHAWPEASVKLPKDIEDFAIRTELGWPKDKDDKPVPAPWAASIAGVQYPAVHTHKVADPMGGPKKIEVPLYDGKSVLFARVAVKPDAPAGEQTLTLVLTHQACNDQMCLPPEDAKLPVKVTIVPAGTADLGAENEPKLFETFKPAPTAKPEPKKGEGAKPAAGGGAGASAVPPPGSSGPGGTPSAAPTAAGPRIFGLGLAQNFFVLFLASALGGFVLNLTPCVLPVIPIKVQTLTQHATSRSRALALGLWMAAGVVAFWLVIGLPMALISRGLDPSQYIFGIWWITLGLGLVIAVLALGIMGMFTFSLPQSVYMVETKADTPTGSFMFGVLTGVLGLPCFGFIAGGLLAAAATMPAWAIITVFGGIGVGMAAPYLVLSVYPQLLKFLPKTGPASDLVKQVMGLLLLAAAAFFVAAGLQVLVQEKPYITASLQWWAVVFFILVACVWLIVRVLQVARTPLMRAAIPALGVGLTATAVVLAANQMSTDRTTYLARKAAMTSQRLGDVPAGVWLEYTPELLAAVRKDGRPVFLDFTASWCITCKALKAAVLVQDPVATVFKERGVVIMEVDCSARGGEGSKLLAELGRTGVPAWAVYGPDAKTPVFVPVDTPTPATVIASLDEARVPKSTAPLTTASSGGSEKPSK